MRFKFLTFFVSLFPVGGLSCSTQASNTTTNPPSKKQGGAQDAAVHPYKMSACSQIYSAKKDKTAPVEAEKAQRILALVNSERAKIGAAPLEYSLILEKAAQVHAYDMGTRNFFSHTSPENCDMTSRIADFAEFKGSTFGENIAAGSDTPEKTVAQWMASPGHRANILNKAYRELGVGYLFSSTAIYQHYWVQDFGA